MGEKSNKYFLNINKNYQNKSYIQETISEGRTLTNIYDKLEAVYTFYSSLYDKSHSLIDPEEFLYNTTAKTLPLDHSVIYRGFDCNELLASLKRCGNTASGPDGISFRLLKTVWQSYGGILLDSWNYALESGRLAPSHRTSVICLIEKKNKDKRLIKNLRPISLSN